MLLISYWNILLHALAVRWFLLNSRIPFAIQYLSTTKRWKWSNFERNDRSKNEWKDETTICDYRHKFYCYRKYIITIWWWNQERCNLLIHVARSLTRSHCTHYILMHVLMHSFEFHRRHGWLLKAFSFACLLARVRFLAWSKLSTHFLCIHSPRTENGHFSRWDWT